MIHLVFRRSPWKHGSQEGRILRWDGFKVRSGGLKIWRTIFSLSVLTLWVMSAGGARGEVLEGRSSSKAGYQIAAAEVATVFESHVGPFLKDPGFCSERDYLIPEAEWGSRSEAAGRISFSLLLFSSGNFVRAP